MDANSNTPTSGELATLSHPLFSLLFNLHELETFNLQREHD